MSVEDRQAACLHLYTTLCYIAAISKSFSVSQEQHEETCNLFKSVDNAIDNDTGQEGDIVEEIEAILFSHIDELVDQINGCVHACEKFKHTSNNYANCLVIEKLCEIAQHYLVEIEDFYFDLGTSNEILCTANIADWQKSIVSKDCCILSGLKYQLDSDFTIFREELLEEISDEPLYGICLFDDETASMFIGDDFYGMLYEKGQTEITESQLYFLFFIGHNITPTTEHIKLFKQLSKDQQEIYVFGDEDDDETQQIFDLVIGTSVLCRYSEYSRFSQLAFVTEKDYQELKKVSDVLWDTCVGDSSIYAACAAFETAVIKKAKIVIDL